MVKVTIEANGKTDVFEGDFFCGFVGTRDKNKGCSIANMLIGNAPVMNIPKYLAETAVGTVKNLPQCKENSIVKHGMLIEFTEIANELTQKEMSKNADTLGKEISEFLKHMDGEA